MLEIRRSQPEVSFSDGAVITLKGHSFEGIVIYWCTCKLVVTSDYTSVNLCLSQRSAAGLTIAIYVCRNETIRKDVWSVASFSKAGAYRCPASSPYISHEEGSYTIAKHRKDNTGAHGRL